MVHLEDRACLVHWVHSGQKDQYKVEVSLTLLGQLYQIYQQHYRMAGLQMRTLGLNAVVVVVVAAAAAV